VSGRIDQILAGFADGDAISNEAMILQEIFRGWGVKSDLFVDSEKVSSDVAGACRPLCEYAAGGDDIAIHHYSISSPSVDVFLGSRAKKVLIYHNITPGHFFDGYDDEVASLLREARSGLSGILPKMDAIWADSAFNARELVETGARDPKVLPLLFSGSRLGGETDRFVTSRFGGPLRNILFVGRIVPNKRVEDLITAFARYHRAIERHSRLIVAGSDRSAPRYFAMLKMLTSELDVPNVFLTGFVSPAALSGCYDVADLFVTASEHEGYCLPLVEAMHKGVPVIARERGGMPEALGGAGIMYDDLLPGELAELIHRVMVDKALRQDILDSQERRMAELRARRADDEVGELLAEIS
jgi:glycosyltransferase involved in cell wall biosynthesis